MKKLPEELRKRSRRDKSGLCDRRFDSVFDVVDHYDGWIMGEDEFLECVLLDGEDVVNVYELDADRHIDWKKVAMGLMLDYIPAINVGGNPGRPQTTRRDLVKRVDRIRADKGCSAKTACAILERRLEQAGETYGVSDLLSAYKRDKRKLGEKLTE